MDSNNNTNGFSSPRGDAFPHGLRVLVVDDDPTWLKILEKMLKKCSYEVTTCGLATEALDLLRERKDGFDIVISDVNMPDMDGFKLLEQVGLEMDLPVIMMSVDGETSRVMKGVQHGACDYLSKPIRMKELKNIWQHVLRKRIHETRDIEGHEGLEEIQMIRNGISDQFDDGFFFCGGGDFNFGKKRKDFENKHDDKDFGDSSTAKKTRVVWTVDLHQKFVKAVNQIGFDKVGPKKILDLMNVPWLTRENVASHLQKYRLYLSRLQKDNDFKTSNGGVKHSSDLISKEQAGNIVFQNSINMKQRDAAANSNYGIPQNSIIMKQSDEAANSNYGIPQNSIIMKQSDEAANSSYGIPQNSVNTKQNDSANCNFGIISANIVIQNANTRIHESRPVPEPERVVICDAHETQKASSSVIGLNHNFGSLEPEANYSAFCSIVPPQHSWTRGVPEIQFKQEHQSHLDLNNGFNHLPLPDDLHNQIQVNNHLQPIPSIYPRHFNKERDKLDLGPLRSGSPTTNYHPSQPITRSTWSMNNQVVDPILTNDLNSGYGNFSSPLPACLLQEDCSPINFELQNKEFYDCNNPELIAEVPPYLYDALRFDYEYSCDSTEYPVIDQGLFIV